MLDSCERFSVTADLYERYRPAYPAPLVDWIVQAAALVPGDAVADVGCGTGISTRLLAARGFQTVGVDPSEAMLTRAGLRPWTRGPLRPPPVGGPGGLSLPDARALVPDRP